MHGQTVIINMGCCCKTQPGKPAPPKVELRCHNKEEDTMDLALVMTNRQYYTGKFTPSNMDVDGQVFKNSDGTDLDPTTLPVNFIVDDASICEVTEDPDQPGGQDIRINSLAIGQTVAVAQIGPYPNGQMAEVSIAVTILNSSPAAATLEGTVHDEP